MMDESALLSKMRETLLALRGENGFRVSTESGDISGRYTALASLLLLHAHDAKPDQELLDACKASLLFLTKNLGARSDPMTGEEPGKFPNVIVGSKVVYDSADATPLALIAIHRYWEKTHDDRFLSDSLGAVRAGIDWMRQYLDTDEDGLADYSRMIYDRLQSWMDSKESIFDKKTGRLPSPPVAPVELQGYTWLAFRLWGEFYVHDAPDLAKELLENSAIIKEEFNRRFVYREHDNLYYAVQAIDGRGRQVKNQTANPMLALAVAHMKGKEVECIVDGRFVYDFVRRAFKYDLFDAEAGIRTMSKLASDYDPKSSAYHTGGFWPGLNGLIFDGLLAFGYTNAAAVLREAALKPIALFGTPVEVYTKNEMKLIEYKSPEGAVAAKAHLWSVAAAYDMLVSGKLVPARSTMQSMEQTAVQNA